jgi:hypothetical protein
MTEKGKTTARVRAVRAALNAMESLIRRDEAAGTTPRKDTLYAIQLALAATTPAGRRKKK